MPYPASNRSRGYPHKTGIPLVEALSIGEVKLVGATTRNRYLHNVGRITLARHRQPCQDNHRVHEDALVDIHRRRGGCLVQVMNSLGGRGAAAKGSIVRSRHFNGAGIGVKFIVHRTSMGIGVIAQREAPGFVLVSQRIVINA